MEISPLLFPHHFIPQNYVHWTQTPHSHIYSVELPGQTRVTIRKYVKCQSHRHVWTQRFSEIIKSLSNYLLKRGLTHGVRTEDIRVEVEDSIYMIIRTEATDESQQELARRFMRKFRLPNGVEVNNISAGYEDGVLTVTVPRTFVRRGFFIEPADRPAESLQVSARAA